MKRLECKLCPKQRYNHVEKRRTAEGEVVEHTLTTVKGPLFRTPRQFAQHLEQEHPQNEGARKLAQQLRWVAREHLRNIRQQRHVGGAK